MSFILYLLSYVLSPSCHRFLFCDLPLWNLLHAREKCYYGCICPADTVQKNSWSTPTQLPQAHRLITARAHPHTPHLGGIAAVPLRDFIYSDVFPSIFNYYSFPLAHCSQCVLHVLYFSSAPFSINMDATFYTLRQLKH